MESLSEIGVIRWVPRQVLPGAKPSSAKNCYKLVINEHLTIFINIPGESSADLDQFMTAVTLYCRSQVTENSNADARTGNLQIDDVSTVLTTSAGKKDFYLALLELL